MSVVPIDTQIVSYEGSFCKELAIRMNKILNKSQPEHDRESALRCDIHKELSLDEYDEWIQDMNLLPNNKICIVELTPKYNKYFDTNITPSGLGVILSKSDKLIKTIALPRNKKIVDYSKA